LTSRHEINIDDSMQFVVGNAGRSSTATVKSRTRVANTANSIFGTERLENGDQSSYEIDLWDGVVIIDQQQVVVIGGGLHYAIHASGEPASWTQIRGTG
jgi:hypothetical protein